ncbi:uncharacterized protein LOC107885072 [Acyrthosiphon pisum]|uniref:Uncharacterized protein n=1 Tax=Acyrthosiphon pisum TaxID=7029 RepID=A0A8R2NLS6_ACYPI|nr:uncharacterized protein LOC107885072 [Acyrthosiphon pisum]
MNDSKDAQLNGTRNWKTRPRQIQEKWNTLAVFKDDKLVLMKFNNTVNESDQNETLCASIGLQIQNILNKLCICSVNGQLPLENHETTNIFNLQTYITTKLLEKCSSSVNKEQFILINNITKVLNIGKIFKNLKSNTSKIVQLLQISRLEDRLKKLEVNIGSEKSILMRLADSNNSDGLVEAVYILRELSKLILPQINVIESRIVYLLPKLKQITSKKLDQNLEVHEKTNKLYEFILREREKSNLLPHTIQRMTILEIFRHKVEKFAVTMNNLRTQYSETSKTLKNNELLLNNIETYIPKHLASVVSNLQSLNARIEVFDDRLKNIEM